MDFKIYQKQARLTAQYPNLGSNNIYPTLGLVGEAGEVAEKVKKVIRDKKGICLLYTSPSPRDQRGSRMPSSA